MGRKINNTTALIAAFSLSFPTVVPAQQLVEECEADSFAVTADMVVESGLMITEDQAAALQGAEVSQDIVIGNVDGEPALCLTMAQLAELNADDAQLAMITGTQPEAEAEEEAAAEAAPEVVEPEVEAGAEAEVTEEAQAEAEEQMDEAIDNAKAATEEGQAEAETAEAEVQEQIESAETEAEMDAEAETAEAEGETEVEAEPAATEEETTAEADAPVTSEEPEARPESDTAAAQIEEEIDAAVAEAATTASALSEELQAEAEQIEAQAAQEADPERQAEVAEQEAPAESAASNEDAQAAEVEETVVTEENSRSSSEEFEGQMETTANARASSDDDDDDGLSNFEKALLVGLGAVVVGKALGDNSDAQVVSKSQDRVVVLQDGRYRVLRDDNELIERPGSNVRRETFEDGSTRTLVTRENGVQIMTIRDPELRVLRRVRIDPDGTRTVLIDDTTDIEPVEVASLPEPVETVNLASNANADELRAALERTNRADRRFALYQVRNIERVRKLAPAIQLEAINFRTGSAVIEAQEAEELSQLGNLITDIIADNPGEMFLIEGHTDAVGNAAMNLALSDRRAESVALALTEYFDVPPENLVVQGYGESDLKVLTLGAERENRRAAVRRITPLIQTASR